MAQDASNSTISLSDVWTAAGAAWDQAGPALGWLVQTLFNLPAYTGVISAFAAGAAVFVWVGLRQNRSAAHCLRRYRYAEPYLILKRKLSVPEMVEYHRSYRWGDWAIVALSSAIVASAIALQDAANAFEIFRAGLGAETGALTPELAAERKRQFEQAVVIIVSCSGLAVGGTILTCVDIVFTNTLSPVVPTAARFRIVDKCIIYGGLGVTLCVASVISFLSVANPLLSILGAVAFFWTLTTLTKLRELPKDEMLAYFGLSDDDWAALNHAVGGGRLSLDTKGDLDLEPPDDVLPADARPSGDGEPPR